jgi:hypothetical protein
MVGTMTGFMRAMLGMPGHWVAWVGLLLLANMIAPLFLLHTIEARVVLGAILMGGVIQMAIFARLGFVRLLGLGHAPWLVLVPWLWMRLDQAEPGTFLSGWLVAVIVLDGASLVIDGVDVARYLRGERTPAAPPAKSPEN